MSISWVLYKNMSRQVKGRRYLVDQMAATSALGDSTHIDVTLEHGKSIKGKNTVNPGLGLVSGWQ